MNWKWIERLTAGFVLLWSLVLYLLTVAPTVSFWDAGEFIASVYKLQVMHPPGAPFYMLVGRFFSMLAPSAETVAYAVNLISVLASAGTVLLTHLIIVRLVRRWQEPEGDERSTSQRVMALTSGVVGALTYAATDSFWFNAVEAEVYALSMFFTAAAVYLVMRWSAEAREEEARLGGRTTHPFSLGANRYLVLIAYLFGLAIGVHLLNLLAFFFIALIVFFTEFDRAEWDAAKRWQGIVLTGVVSAVIFFVIYPGVVLWLPEFLDWSNMPFVAALFIAAAVVYGIYYTHTRTMVRANLALLCLAMVLTGYSSYSLIYIRSQTEPSIDLNDPDTPERFVSYLKREQYGSTPLLYGATYDEEAGRVEPESNMTVFPRRHSVDPRHHRVYERYNSDLDFFLRYQIGHMYVRYFLWNFAGRASDEQDAPAMTGISAVDPPSVTERVVQTPSEDAARNVYFALPLLLGLFGAFYHFSRDWKRAFSVFILFFVTGIGIIIYLNQTPMQPRERDYSYVASFFAFSLWVGIGAGGLLQMLYEGIRDSVKGAGRTASLLATGLAIFLLVPGWMTQENYDDHDRSGRYVAHDYAYNMLNSVAENGVIFTNGDNDTYPLWYLQEVEGVRQDVRVVNLSLLNTPWYIQQLKNEQQYESEPLPISWSDDQIQNVRPRYWEPKQVQLPVDVDAIQSTTETYLPQTETDTSRIESPMTWTLEGRPLGQDRNMLRTADLIAYNILRTTAENGWERPIYFAVTVARSGQLNLQNYFQLEGQSYRVVPIKHNQTFGRVVPGLTAERMEQFRFTNLADPDVYFDENARRMIDGYRLQFSHAGERLSRMGETEAGQELLTRIVNEVPFSTIAGDLQTYLLTARALEATGNAEMMASIMEQAEPLVLNDLRTANSRRNFSYALRYAGMVRSSYLDANKTESLDAFDEQVETLLAQAPYEVPQRIRKAYGLSTGSDTTGTNVPENLQQPGVTPPSTTPTSPPASDPSGQSGSSEN
jgi:hypothetical protein